MVPQYLSVCMNPTLQKTLVFPGLVIDTVNRAARHRFDASGKGVNVSRVLTQLGKSCVHLTQLGGIFRPFFLDLCAKDNIPVEWVESGSPIRFCHTLINEGDHTVTELVEEGEPVGEGTGERLKAAFVRLLAGAGRVIISGSKAAGLGADLVPFMAREAAAAGCKLILDLRGADLKESLPFGVDIIKPNLFEFAGTFAPELIERNEIIACEGRVKERVRAICRELRAAYHSRIVLTRGAKPVWIFEGDDLSELAPQAVEPLNTIGSGDAFTAGLAAALDEGASLREAAAAGNRCGALNAALLRPGVIR